MRAMFLVYLLGIIAGLVFLLTIAAPAPVRSRGDASGSCASPR